MKLLSPMLATSLRTKIILGLIMTAMLLSLVVSFAAVFNPSTASAQTFGPGDCCSGGYCGMEPQCTFTGPTCEELAAAGFFPTDCTGAPTIDLTATPTTINSGSSSSLSWYSTNVTSCSIDNGVGAVIANASGTRTVTPTSSTTYTITCDSASGQVTDQAVVTVTANPQPFNAYCSAGPEVAQVGETVQWSAYASTGSSGLTWKQGTPFTSKTCTGGQNYTSLNTCGDISNGDACTVEGAKCRQAAECDTYTDSGGQTNAHTTYGSVTPFTCTSGSGSTNTYSWSGTDGLSGATQNVSKAYATTGTKSGQVNISSSTGASASAVCTASVTGQSPTATLTASPSSITAGSASTLTWGSTNAASCSLNESIGTVATSGSRSVSPGGTTTYTLVCSAPASSTSGTWQYYDEDLTDYSCPLAQPYKAYSGLANCPSNPQGQACTGNQLCKINEYSGQACTVRSTLYECRGATSSPAQNATASTTVTVAPAPTVTSCSVSPTSITAGGSATWTALPTGLVSYTFTPSETGTGVVRPSNTYARTYATPGTYGMSVTAGGSTVACSNSVTVGAVPCGTATPTITAVPDRVTTGGTSVLTVSASGVDGTCTVTGPGVNQTLTASSCGVPSTTINTPALTGQSTYTISCDGGEATAKTVINVATKWSIF